MRRITILFFVLSMLIATSGISQLQVAKNHFTNDDTLRGSIGPGRSWWKLVQYNLRVNPDYTSKTIQGSNEIRFRVISQYPRMQIDLQQPLLIDSILFLSPAQHGHLNPKRQKLSFQKNKNLWLVNMPSLPIGTVQSIEIYYHGKPREAVRPPWDGGWIWTRDSLGRPWMSVACQGLGASVWYPCKDHQSDEPDSGATLAITVPDTLMAVANGRLIAKLSHEDGTVTYTWKVVNPINNYDLIPYIGKYATWHKDFAGEKGKLDCDYWVLDYNLEKAQKQFLQADTMLHCFEYWFGPYPFYQDSYKLVEAPHLGMEHQSAVAYGNKFINGYKGTDLSGTGWGLKWDFIIVHESGHEWFGNNITSKDIADSWIHEGITNYSETIYTTCLYGVEAGNDYCIGTRKKITNKSPLITSYGVNEDPPGTDIYYKGGNMMHLIRQLYDDDEKFRLMLRGMNLAFYHQTVATRQVEDYISQHSGKDLSKLFDQYLRHTEIPTLQYKLKDNQLSFRWTNCVEGFNMPVKLANTDSWWIEPTTEWKTISLKKTEKINALEADRNFYIQVQKAN